MNCRLFHDWGKWGTPVTETWEQHFLLSQKAIEYIIIKQHRECQRCGKIEGRELTTNE